MRCKSNHEFTVIGLHNHRHSASSHIILQYTVSHDQLDNALTCVITLEVGVVMGVVC